jgi:cytochrome c oxidase subunit 2
VAATPETVKRLLARGARVWIETEAGSAAGFSDAAFDEAGAEVFGTAESLERWRQAARLSPLAPSPNAAADLWRPRQERGNRGWATVPPAPPPLVNVPLDPTAAHEG